MDVSVAAHEATGADRGVVARDTVEAAADAARGSEVDPANVDRHVHAAGGPDVGAAVKVWDEARVPAGKARASEPTVALALMVGGSYGWAAVEGRGSGGNANVSERSLQMV